MDCNVINDLIPLYIDQCCSDQSAALVAQHLETCEECRRTYEQMRRSEQVQEQTPTPVKLQRVSEWKASVLQSVMLFFAFAVITIGVTLESKTPEGSSNGLWAIALIIPATGYLLSLANWFFVRSYRSRRAFSNGSLIATAGCIAGGFLWAVLHYQSGIPFHSPLVWCALAFSIVLCVLSKICSDRYARLLGKE